jgi:hypothetical protein
VRGSKAAGEAVVLAFNLIQEVDEAEAVMRLQASPGGRRTLRNAAEMTARNADNGYPYGPAYRLLRAASGDPVPPPNREELAAEARERQLLLQPLPTSFDELAEQVPALRELEQQLRDDPAAIVRDLPAAGTDTFGGTIPDPSTPAGQALILTALHEGVRRLVGPHSGQSDRVLASSAALNLVCDHLRPLTGINPR